MRAQLARVASRVEEERWAEEEEEDASWSEVGQAAKDPELREAEEAAAAAAALAASDPSVRLEAEAAAKRAGGLRQILARATAPRGRFNVQAADPPVPPAGWLRSVDVMGRVFYVNTASRATAWEVPPPPCRRRL